MASSDDEEEIVPEAVTNYYFVDGDESPISFAVLPLHFDGGEKPNESENEVFLHGTTDGGLQKVYKQVSVWKLGFQDVKQPEISVLSKEDGRWMTLLKPRNSYEQSFRTIMVTVQMLHFLRKNPESSEKSLWDHLRKVYVKFEVRPSEDDLRDHLSLIRLFAERDETLGKSALLMGFLTDKPRKKFGEGQDAMQSFIADDDEVDEIMEDDSGDESDEDSDLFDSVCAICDNGGDLLCCEGKCMRSFHATRRDGEDSFCRSLGYTRAQVEAIQNFLCKNCELKEHQCFACGKLGSSNKEVGTAEVFRCVIATCGRFYHPKCVAKLLFPKDEAEASESERKISSGTTFTCPSHFCVTCQGMEDKENDDLRFAMCRRCPKSYHKKCLPSEICFEDDEEEGIIQRAWDELLPNRRILIYCLKHKMDENIRTPVRNHIVFPDDPEKKTATEVQKQKLQNLLKKKKPVSDDLSLDRASVKPRIVKEKFIAESKPLVKIARSVKTQHPVAAPKKVKPMKEKVRSDLDKAEGTASEIDKQPMKGKAKTLAAPTASSTPTGKVIHSSFPGIDSETEKKLSLNCEPARIISIMEKVSSSIKLDNVISNRTMPSTYAYSAKHIDKVITRGKIEVSLEAIQAAIQKIDEGGNLEDAKALCEPEIVKQLIKWNGKLKVYLAPFIHGMRYTSFGRHFTKPDKLKEIVDFCCGANDFSLIMQEKLDAARKRCNYKNYDVLQPKNDFNFEKRDWMKVHPKELPMGSQLIMGLNPPFGVKAALANKFIDKALTFKPKLLILIVPQETQRLEKKKTPYDLIWEDGEILRGKAFYLPGSVDDQDKQIEQWNVKPPVLYLWSRQDWTLRHMEIATENGHLSREFDEARIETEFLEDTIQVEEEAALCVENHMDVEYEQEGSNSNVSGKDTWREDSEIAVSRTDSTSKVREIQKEDANIVNENANKGEDNRILGSRIDANSKEKETCGEHVENVGFTCIDSKPREKEAWREDSKSSGSRVDANARNEERGNDKGSRVDTNVRNEERGNNRDIGSHYKRKSPENQNSKKRKRRRRQSKMAEGLQFVNIDALSDMSISPTDSRGRNQPIGQCVLEPIETPLERLNQYGSYSLPRPEYGTMPTTGLNTSALDDNIEELVRKYTAPNNEGFYSGNSHNWSASGIGIGDYPRRTSEERYPDFAIGSSTAEPFRRSPFLDDFNGFGRLGDAPGDTRVPQRSHAMQGDDYLERNNRYSFGGLEPRVGLPSGVFPSSSSYALSTPNAGTSAMDRYAPRLDETNYMMPGNHGYHHQGVSGTYDMHAMMRRDSMPPPDPMPGFRPRPQNPYPHHGSSGGWIDG
ncbi:Protein ENHANCED DOWNY MILDEW 2 [Ananas comosus]|uniref:Protein ENHANCED DOWNY MILDEW 2 n=1 Tax=Ananas comosus TaxID=4615 RepID=A0A199UVS1_ANACO|nr:Protein ENHANCED DOWNY MILDEW 2 [Ananas comosus]